MAPVRDAILNLVNLGIPFNLIAFRVIRFSSFVTAAQHFCSFFAAVIKYPPLDTLFLFVLSRLGDSPKVPKMAAGVWGFFCSNVKFEFNPSRLLIIYGECRQAAVYTHNTLRASTIND